MDQCATLSNGGPPAQAVPHRGNSVKIVDFIMTPNRPSQLKLRKGVLRDILKEVGDCRVYILSIAGASRQGKSFFLSIILQVLKRLELKATFADLTEIWDDMMKLSSLEGFEFKTDKDRVTVGLWLWSHPFIFTQEDGTQLAVLLMDTQGVFDKHTNKRDWSMIVGLSLLTSSCMIYNLFNNLQEDSLEILKTFLDFGAYVLNADPEASSPFQKLIFLIRDWQFPDSCPYGRLGGDMLLEDTLKVQQTMPQDLQVVRQTIKQCFDQIECFLMPHPGDAVRSKDFNGCLQALHAEFRKNCRNFIEDLLIIDDMKAKTIGGNILTGSEILPYFEKYIAIFNQQGNPKPISFFEGTQDASLEAIKDQALAEFNKLSEKFMQSSSSFISAEDIITAHQPFLLEATHFFSRKATSFKCDKLVAKHKGILGYEIQEALRLVIESTEQRQGSALKQLTERSVLNYKAAVAEEMALLTFEPGQLEALLSSIKARIKADISSYLGECDYVTLQKVATHLNDLMKAEDTFLVERNTSSFDQLKIKYLEVINKCVKKYRKKLERALENSKNLTEEKVSIEHQLHFEDIQQKFHQEVEFDRNPITNQLFLAKLEDEVRVVLGKATAQAMNSKVEKSDEVIRILGECVESYKLAMDVQSITSQPHISLKETEEMLKQKHRIALLEAKTQMSPIYALLGDTVEAEKHRTTLQQNLEKIYHNMIEHLRNEVASYKTTWTTAQKQIYSTYDATIRAPSESTTAKLPTPEDLTKAHQGFCEQVADRISTWDWILTEDKVKFENEVKTCLKLHFTQVSNYNNEQINGLEKETRALIDTLEQNYENMLDGNLNAGPGAFGYVFMQTPQLSTIHEEVFKNASAEIAAFTERLPEMNAYILQSLLIERLEKVRNSFHVKVDSLFSAKQAEIQQNVERLVQNYTMQMDTHESEMDNYRMKPKPS